MNMMISQKGIDLIKSFEGCRTRAYADPLLANGLPTIGYGHTKGVHLGMTVTLAEAEQLLRDDLVTFEEAVNRLVTVPLTQGEYDALMSYAFNLGVGNLARSDILRAVNQGNFQQAADNFLHWDHAGGQVVAGLTRRRKAERALFLTPDTPVEVTVPTPAPDPVPTPAPTVASWPSFFGKVFGRVFRR